MVKSLPANAGDIRDTVSIPRLGRYPGGGNSNPLQYFCQKIPWREEPGELQSIGSQRVRHNCMTETAHKYSKPITSLSFCYSLLLTMLLRLFISVIS